MNKTVAAALLLCASGCAAPVPNPGMIQEPPAVLANPEIDFIVWGGQDPTKIESDWSTAIGSGVCDRLKEYGVESCSMGPTMLAQPGLQTSVFDDAWISGELLREITPKDDVIYVIVLPPGSSTKSLQALNASGYHFWSGVPYAVVTYNNVLISHEIYEAATDPFGLGIRNLGDSKTEEVGDVCEGKYTTAGPITVQQVWSVAGNFCH